MTMTKIKIPRITSNYCSFSNKYDDLKNHNEDISPKTEPIFEKTNFPVVVTENLNNTLPQYYSVLKRTSKIGSVSSTDLLQLQYNLEQLLSTCVLRKRYLSQKSQTLVSSPIEEPLPSINNNKEHFKKPKNGVFKYPNSYEETVSAKRKKLEIRDKQKTSKNGARNNKINKKDSTPKVSLQRNDTSDRFWLSIEPYCMRITGDDVVFLEELHKECEEKVKLEIPQVEKHYTDVWFEELLLQEKNLSSNQRIVKTKDLSFEDKLSKCDLNKNITITSSLEKRLYTDLLEGNLLKVQHSTHNTSKKISCQSFQERILNELVNENVIKTSENLTTNVSESGVLKEVQKCALELEAVNEENANQLKKLYSMARSDLKCHDIREALNKVDKQIKDIHKKMLALRNASSTVTTTSKLLVSTISLKEYEEEARRLLNQQSKLEDELLQHDSEDFN